MGGRNGGDGAVLQFCQAWQARADPGVRTLMAEHASLRELCDALEVLADGLPDLPPAAERHAAVRALTDLLPAHQQREIALMGSLLAAEGRPAMTRALLDRIHGQHLADMVHAQDLGAALELADGGGNARALGYMLRCFFDGCRRALAFEELAILKMSRRLSPATRDMLTANLALGQGWG